MDIKTKFDVGQFVYAFKDLDAVLTYKQISARSILCRLQRWRVRSIIFDGDEIMYELCCSLITDDIEWYTEKDIFSTSNDCVVALANRRLQEAQDILSEWSAILNAPK